jgi:hypothetical protein
MSSSDCSGCGGCGGGGWGGPLPGDPDNNSILKATSDFGGVEVSWSYPNTNPHAVSFFRVYRGITNDFNGAIVIANVSGDRFFDSDESVAPVQRFYWIQIVSINGTTGELIGPAAAVSKPNIEQTIAALSGKINATLLSKELSSLIGEIPTVKSTISGEISDRIKADQAAAAALGNVQVATANAVTLINSEVSKLVLADQAVIKQVDLMGVKYDGAIAGVKQEIEVKAGPNSALAKKVNTLESTVTDPNTGLQKRLAQVESTVTTFTGAGGSTAQSLTTLGSKVGTLETNYSAIKQELTAATTANTTQASSITTLTSNVTDANKAITSQASIQVGLKTDIDKINGTMNTMYTVKLQASKTREGKPLIGGFGLANSGTSIDAVFDVNTFSIGAPNSNGIKPFIVDNGVVYISQAAIKTLSFNKLADDSGTFLVQNGKLRADKVDVGEIELRSGVTGGRMIINKNNITIFDDNNMLRVKIGNLLI